MPSLIIEDTKGKIISIGAPFARSEVYLLGESN
ncbi:predicted protein [Sclerotinia sclerotiorum 1980 UF-70]|uniref:Uncharacterized protein n=1 Tax=Sclerotinia sclerotiorum (strain ATCC 18683 / 1980 / Ss-1) TaxID=665079 RepID=A7EKB4_SCLS1|nr:predicted protein [Sclerotinia sclerotiorum 1980 UF-70]EDO03280.1 predicted protein [Sclerotinia sclerotiorum 1980 UF-70]